MSSLQQFLDNYSTNKLAAICKGLTIHPSRRALSSSAEGWAHTAVPPPFELGQGLDEPPSLPAVTARDSSTLRNGPGSECLCDWRFVPSPDVSIRSKLRRQNSCSRSSAMNKETGRCRIMAAILSTARCPAAISKSSQKQEEGGVDLGRAFLLHPMACAIDQP